LARCDRGALQAQYAQASASLAAARAALQQSKTDRQRARRDELRALILFTSKSISEVARDDASAAARLAEQRVDAAEAEVAARLAAHQLAQTNLAHAVILAPIDGVVITRSIDPGQTVASVMQTPVLFTVAADLRKMQVIASVDEADIGEVREGQTAEFSVHAYPDRLFPARVTAVRNAAQVVQDVVTYGVELSVDNLDLLLKPGMTASVRIRTQSVNNALRVPLAALSFIPPGEKQMSPAIWTLKKGALTSIPVAIGIHDGERVQVTGQALAEGQRVLTELTPEGRTAYGLAP
jgi:HlyD family secretion protein